MKIELGPKLFSFNSHNQWLNFTAHHWRKHACTPSNTICVDQAGRVCRFGLHFLKALVENQFPVDVYLMRKDQTKRRQYERHRTTCAITVTSAISAISGRTKNTGMQTLPTKQSVLVAPRNNHGENK